VWGCGTPRHGGFEEKKRDQRLGACQLIEGILNLSLPHAADITLHLYFDPQWHHNWPRPPIVSPDCMVVPITVHKGVVSLDSWKSFAISMQAGDIVAKRAWADLCLDRLVAEHGTSVPASKLLFQVASADSYRFLLAQLAAGFANLMEATWLGTTSSSTSVRDALGFQWLDIDEGFEKRFQVDRKLYSYVSSCSSCRVNWQFMTMGSDKGDAPGMVLTHSHFAFPDNQAFIGVPQAKRGCQPNRGVNQSPKN